MNVLATRPLLGYPSAEVELIVDGDNYTVKVVDHNGGMQFGTTQSRQIAKDWYFHPFVYGYEYHKAAQQGEDDVTAE